MRIAFAVLFAVLVAGSVSSEVSSLSDHRYTCAARSHRLAEFVLPLSELELLQEGSHSVNDATAATASATESVSLADDAKTAEEASKQDQEEAKVGTRGTASSLSVQHTFCGSR